MTDKRRSLPQTRRSITKKFKLGYTTICEGCQSPRFETLRVYFTVGLYDDGTPGELFIKADKMGSLTSGALEGLAIMMSMALQYGAPIHVLTDKFRHMKFEPSGVTGDPQFPMVHSILDALAQWLNEKFPKGGD